MKVKIGDSVIISDPKHKDSPHEHSFSGIVVSINTLGADVADGNGDVFSIEFDEIEEIDNQMEKTMTETRKNDYEKTGEIVIFGEHKAGSSFWTKFVNIKDVPKEFLKDLKELIEYLVSDEVSHPYDGVVAGSIA